MAALVAGAAARVSVLDRKRKVELAAKLAVRWQRWEISNFDYLMQLNTLSGEGRLLSIMHSWKHSHLLLRLRLGR